MIGKGIFHGDQDFFDLLIVQSASRDNLEIKKSRDLHEKSRDLSYYEIFQQKILKSQTFKKSVVYW